MTETGSGLHLEVLGSAFHISAPDEEWAHLLEQLWRPFVRTGTGDGSKVEVVRTHEGWQLRTDEGAFDSANPWVVADELRHHVIETALGDARDILDLHAAAVVAPNGRVVLLAGPSGAGKTTVTLALAARGWKVLSDDVAPIDRTSKTIVPFPKPIGIRDVARWTSLSDRWEPPSWAVLPEGALLVPATVLPLEADEGLRAHSIAFLRYSKDEKSQNKEIGVAEAAARCTQFVRRVDPDVVSSFVSLCREMGRFELVFHSSDDAVAAISAHL